MMTRLPEASRAHGGIRAGDMHGALLQPKCSAVGVGRQGGDDARLPRAVWGRRALAPGTDGAPAVVVLPQREHRKVDMDIAKLEQQKVEVAQQHKAKRTRKGKGVPKDPNRPKNYM
jgi:hypothetical protein